MKVFKDDSTVFVNPGILDFVLEAWSGCIQAGWGSDLWLSAVVLWNSAPHVSTMLGSNLDLSDLVLDILHHNAYIFLTDKLYLPTKLWIVFVVFTNVNTQHPTIAKTIFQTLDTV